MISFLLTSCSMRNTAESSSNISSFSDVSATHINSAVSESSDLIETHEIIFYNTIQYIYLSMLLKKQSLFTFKS